MTTTTATTTTTTTTKATSTADGGGGGGGGSSRARQHGDGSSTATVAAQRRRQHGSRGGASSCRSSGGGGARRWRRHGGGGGDGRRGGVLEVLFVMCSCARVGGPLFFCHLLLFVTFSLAPYYLFTSTWEFVVYVLIYVRMWSVFGTSMSANPDIKVSRHTQIRVANIGLSGQNLATFRDVGDMSATCRRHFQPLYGPCKFSLKKNDPFLTSKPPKVSIFCRCSRLVNSPLLLAICSVVIQHSYGKF